MMKPKADNNDKMLKELREISGTGANKQCFDCGQRGVTAIDMTIGSFVCTTCSGILRGLTPPHRVKSISMAKFTADELDFLRTHGNDECAKTWLGLWDSKRTIKQDHREFMIDKYERKRYYLEPASPLKSINTSAPVPQQPQQQPITNGFGKISHQQVDNSLAVLKSIQLTPPAANDRHHHRIHHQNGFSSESQNNNKNNFFNQQNNLNGNSTSANGSIKSESDISNEFIADFSKASIYNSNNSLNSTGSGGHVNGKMTNGTTTNGDLNANFADFANNKIYNAAGLPMTKNSLSNSLNSSGGTFNSNSSLNSTPSADRYAALKDLDEQLRDAKTDVAPTEPAAIPVNPFKNPFQSPPQQQQQQQQQQQSFQNWSIPESQSPFNGFGSPLNSNGFSNGFYYNHNMTNGIISQPSAFGKQGGFGNPFVTSGSAGANNPFL